MLQFKVRVKTNDNGNVEEWCPAKLVLEGTDEAIDALIEYLIELTDRIRGAEARIMHLEQMLANGGTIKAIELRSQLIERVNGHNS